MGQTAKVITDKKTEIQQKELTLLSDASVTFVSLVSHGANGEPFLIVKSRKDEKAEFTEKVVQRVIIAKDMPEAQKMEILMTKVMQGATKKEYDTYEAYDQFPKEACVPGSFSGMTLHGVRSCSLQPNLPGRRSLNSLKKEVRYQG